MRLWRTLKVGHVFSWAEQPVISHLTASTQEEFISGSSSPRDGPSAIPKYQVSLHALSIVSPCAEHRTLRLGPSELEHHDLSSMEASDVDLIAVNNNRRDLTLQLEAHSLQEVAGLDVDDVEYLEFDVAIKVKVAFVASVDHKDPPVRSCDSLVATIKPPCGDRAQESAIEVEQLQPRALRMAIASQHDHLVAVHRDIAEGVKGIMSINCGDDP